MGGGREGEGYEREIVREGKGKRWIEVEKQTDRVGEREAKRNEREREQRGVGGQCRVI